MLYLLSSWKGINKIKSHYMYLCNEIDHRCALLQPCAGRLLLGLGKGGKGRVTQTLAPKTHNKRPHPTSKGLGRLTCPISQPLEQLSQSQSPLNHPLRTIFHYLHFPFGLHPILPFLRQSINARCLFAISIRTPSHHTPVQLFRDGRFETMSS
jgi:hypothetical protein